MRRRLAVLILASLAAPLGAEPDAAWQALPPYQPGPPMTGTIRLWGHGSTKTDFMRRLYDRWIAGFSPRQPGIHFDYRMYGTASAIGALYTGSGDLALLGEEIFPFEDAAYEQVMHRPPASVEIATGSLDVRNFDFAQMFFVHRANPLRSLTLPQLDAIWGTERRLGAPRPIRTWGDLGLTGAWADRPIHLYGWAFDNDFWIYLGQAMLGGSHRLNPAIRGYAHIPRPDGTIYDAGQQIIEALARDPDGLALSNARYATPDVRPLDLARKEGDPAWPATRENLISRRYPLTRIIPAVFNQAPGEPIDPLVREFLRYILSREGQRDIALDGEYLPLDPDAVRRALARLDQIDTATLRVRGDPAMSRLIGLWEDGFRRNHPEAAFENDLTGTASAMAGLYTGKADIAFLGRRIDPVETMAFTWVHRYGPTQTDVASGSRDVPGKSPALAVLVNAANPVSGLTLSQLDATFGVECRRGGRPVLTWGDLGLSGPWASRPVHAFIRETESDAAGFFRDRVLLGSRKWNWRLITEFSDGKKPDGRTLDADEQLAEAVARDPLALAIGDARFAGPAARIVPLSDSDTGPGYLPDRDDLIEGRYPLVRPICAYSNRPPGQAPDPRVDAFLAFIASPAGQALVVREGDYLPLGAAKAPPDGRP